MSSALLYRIHLKLDLDGIQASSQGSVGVRIDTPRKRDKMSCFLGAQQQSHFRDKETVRFCCEIKALPDWYTQPPKMPRLQQSGGCFLIML